jgi:hypothetical protein
MTAGAVAPCREILIKRTGIKGGVFGSRWEKPQGYMKGLDRAFLKGGAKL